MTNLITALDRVEWDSALHRVTDLEAMPVANIYENTAQRPEGERDINRVGALYSRAKFATQVAGSGTAGTAPFDDLLIQACGLDDAITPGANVTYTLNPAFAHTAVDLSCYKGNSLLVPVSNCCGRVEWVMAPNAPMLANWEFVGTYTEPTSASGAAALGTTARPVICKGLVATVAGATRRLKELRINIDNQFEDADEDICGTNGIINPSIYDRNVIITATFRAELPSTKNWWNLLTSESVMEFIAILGTTGGNILNINVDAYYRETIGGGENAGRHETTIVCEMSRVTGDTALTMVYQ